MRQRTTVRQFFTLFAISLAAFLYNQSFADSDNPGSRYLDAYKRYESATCPIASGAIKHFVYFARSREQIHDHALLKHPGIQGAQIMYSWPQLEPERDQYDFSAIEEDLRYLQSHGKALFVQLQDATFSDRYQAAPAYLLTDEFDGGAVPQRNDAGETEGWVVKRWNPEVRARFAKLLNTMGRQFDGRVEGINLQESAIGVSIEYEPSFNDALYAESIKENMSALRSAFSKSTTMQYANFMPGEWLPWEDKGFLKGVYQHGENIGVGLGGPDLMVWRKGQLNHTIAMMHEHEYSVPLGIAVQDGNYIGQTGADGAIADEVRTQRKNLVPMLYEFARDFMGVIYIFWANQEPYLEDDVLSCLHATTAH